ncbi:response regulator transcription factor [Natronomonas sp. LN261]|jgi:DNA-binding response OmpR family regulator|uniref:response regulator transcription factor n=1 Tax=Natronomonas sp. LN261 TaxID=2750669 RepID=UPI0015EFAE5C|nr:winged helix-turn-helix domain-containing protein [Natronomonas sp. LN261]
MPTGNETILAVDDERGLVDIYQAWFDDRYDVRTAYGGREALSTFDGSIDLVLLDRRMSGVSGDEVLETLREAGHDCPVVMVTAVEPDEGMVELPFDEYVLKPVDKKELFETVERALVRASDDTANDVLDALGDEKARRCCSVLNGEVKSAREVANLTGYSLPTVYRRLNTLRQAGLIESRTRIDPGGDHHEVFVTIAERITVELDGFSVMRELSAESKA